MARRKQKTTLYTDCACVFKGWRNFAPDESNKGCKFGEMKREIQPWSLVFCLRLYSVLKPQTFLA